MSFLPLEESARLPFLRFAVPCAGTLVKRGSITQDFLNDLRDRVKRNRPIPKDAENAFKVAMGACSLMALDGGKKFISEEIVRDYFLFGHDEVIGRRFDEMRDFDPEACRTRAGTIQSIQGNQAMVKNDSGKKPYNLDFLPSARVGDRVVTHWDFVVQKIDSSTAKKMKQLKIVSR